MKSMAEPDFLSNAVTRQSSYAFPERKATTLLFPVLCGTKCV
jgi:hypothetical protein